MMHDFLDRIGEWNPQLLRELKGRLKPLNILLAVTISLVGQFILFMYFKTQLPYVIDENQRFNRYCTGNFVSTKDDIRECLQYALDVFVTNSQMWWLDIFCLLSIFGSSGLLIAGTYLLMSDLTTEQRSDTLNFIRLTPQSAQNILLGKMLGVPIFIYIFVALTVPLHLWSGLAVNIPLIEILSFYAVVVAACFFYYSAALLFSLVGSWLGGFQAWLGSGLVLGFLILTQQGLANVTSSYSLVFLKFLNPFFLIPSLEESSLFKYVSSWQDFHWFALPLGASFITTVGFGLFTYIIGSRFIWQALQRCYRDPNATMLNKQQSYLLTFCFTAITLGCTNWQTILFGTEGYSYLMKENVFCLLFLNFWLLLYLIAALSPHRQALQDWARYRHQNISDNKRFGYRSLLKDLIWDEKSPAMVAIALNATIIIICLNLFIVLSRSDNADKFNAIYSVGLAAGLAMIYAALTQLLLFMKTKHRVWWTAGAVSAAIMFPLIISMMFYQSSELNFGLWLFSIFAPIAAMFPSGNSLTEMTIFLGILGQLSIAGFLMLLLTRQLQQAGRS
ncbi:MAG: hypothetical protein ACHBN1_17170 [Heteroscytonema crispum UTEX LB 1556]